MIVRDELSLRRTWPQLSKRLMQLLLFDTVVAGLYSALDFTWVSQPIPLAMMGAALSLFLGFRNNSAYDRWWEARSLWGGLVNQSRTLARQALTLVDPQGDDRAGPEIVQLQIAYVHALRCHLRQQNPFAELKTLLPAQIVAKLRGQRNVPIAILLTIGQHLRQLFAAKRIDSIRFTSMDNTLSELCNLQGACERIKNTPLPRQYEYFPRVLVGMYCVMLPIGLVGSLGMLTPIVSSLVSFIFVALETIGRDLESPFANAVSDTPLTALTNNIEINLRQNIGDPALPNEVRPVHGFVY
ncbi:MAG: hypothetical protein JNK82_03985 [Myxococcaceae bacterium]|nr:hypothetical protein [Myxococcaceae bacterium]